MSYCTLNGLFVTDALELSGESRAPQQSEFGLLNIIITGATGLEGERMLLECLEHPDVRQVLMISIGYLYIYMRK